VSKPDTRYQIRMSAIQYSQRENHLTDLLSPFSSDPRRRTVRVVDDPRAGALLENESEIRVDSPDLALFYLNTVADHRIVGGRRRLAIVDLGLGERNSHRGELTMPAIGSILLALVQGQKHLLRPVPPKRNKASNSQLFLYVEGNGHTPFLSPSLRLYDDLCSPPGTSGDGSTTTHDLAVFGGFCSQNRNDFGVTIASPKRSKSCNLDDDKRQAIMQWVDTCEPLLSPDDDEMNNDRPREILSHPLEDIIEQDEESMRDSIRSKHDTDSHPLSILSREDIEKIMSTEGTPQKEASLTATATSTATPSEMDLYRRASHLENYAVEKLKELDDDKMKKRTKQADLELLSKFDDVVGEYGIAEKEKEELEKRKNELRKRREELKHEADEIRREKEQIDKELNGRSLPLAIARQITQQLHGLTLGSKPSQKTSRAPSDSLPTTPTIHKKQLGAPPARTPSLTNCAAPSLPSPSHHAKNGIIKAHWVDGTHVRRCSKPRTDRRERKVSEEGRREKTAIPSPYSKVTDPRLVDGPPSSGRGSDDAASQCREKKRQSYSASSGYESAAGDYHSAYYLCKDSRFDQRKAVDKRLGLGREADTLREQQRRLKKELQEAKAVIGQIDDARAICHDTKTTGISQATLVDTLRQENRILEKRLIACRNHTMFVTTFL
ncbi:hypothetical protein OSTOST_09574, partial [Ostertagia ostertagi]